MTDMDNHAEQNLNGAEAARGQSDEALPEDEAFMREALPEDEAFMREALPEDEAYMREALAEAEKAADLGEVPVGAVIVRDGAVIARGHNLAETGKDPTLHAEMNAIREAAEVLGGWRLPGCTMYVTLEPCAMCAGALIWARMERLVIGTMDPKAGACGSLMDIVEDDRLNHVVSVTRGVLQDECAALLKQFFSNLRR